MSNRNSNQSKRICIFCGSKKQITREHVLPDWLKKIIPRRNLGHTSFSTRIFAGSKQIAILPSGKRQKQGDLAGRTLLMVCKACNNGWMKIAQDQTKPILAPLIEGHWLEFSERTAAQISHWFAMTAAVIAESALNKGGITAEERKVIREGNVPQTFQIWIGRMSGAETAYSNRNALVVERSKLPVIRPELNCCVTTVVIGQLILHSINVPFPEIRPDPIIYGADMGLMPITPWAGDRLPWQYIPISFFESKEHERILDEYYYSALFPKPAN